VEYETSEEFYGECRIYDDNLITARALEINGFTYQNITDRTKRLPHELIFDFYNWAMARKHQKLLVGQQVGSFDVKFIKRIFDNRLANEQIVWPFGYRTLDLHTLAWRAFGLSLSLDDILKQCGYQPESKPHNALTGAKLECAALKHILFL
jgi:hypothetical protein